MKDRYYSEFISEKFHEKISALRIAKEIQTFECFAFIFVNAHECKCKFIKEHDLKTTKIEDEALTNINNIIVLSYGKWINGSYTNSSYNFIGIFDKEGNESVINIGSIALNSIKIVTNYYFQKVVINSCNITILHNQFYEYLTPITSPIYKTISSATNECNGLYFKSESNIKLNIDFRSNFQTYYVWDFQRVLKDLKEFEQKLSNHLKDTKFDPEITLKQEITFKIKSSEIQF